MAAVNTLESDQTWSLWDEGSLEGAFEAEIQGDNPENIVVTKVNRPILFGYKPEKPNGRGILILGGGGYVQLMVGREGVAVAKWLNTLGFYAFVLVHRFPTSESSPQAPLDDARRALHIMEASGHATKGLSICGLSSGGHLGAALLADYPSAWKSQQPNIPAVEFAILGYGPISTNAKGRTIIENKPPLPPAEKQEFYDVVQPDVQITSPAPPTFIVYSNNDPVVPVVNAYRLAEGLTKAKGSVELHVFADAPHGFALDTPGLPVSKWPSICEEWLRQHNYLS
ncbi:Acetylxylan esterase [Paramyrothecium foliicola]|nr:Acetylxylan esterase [Paramyrothecium foliicola]